MTIEEIKAIYPPFTGRNGSRFVDETGNVFGRLTVLYRSANNSADKKVKWICQCECGNVVEAVGKDMRAGKIVSCGCAKIERMRNMNSIDLVGKRYGKLTVLERTEERDAQGRVIWLCQCDCGQKIKVSTIRLQSGNNKSCGCLRSYGEYLVKQVLQDLNIQYQEQYKFPDLYTETDKRYFLRFDFGVLYENQLQFLIEFDGEQHFKVYEKWHLPFENDKRKNEYCLANNIPLLRIKYTDRNYEAIHNIVLNFIKENNIQCF